MKCGSAVRVQGCRVLLVEDNPINQTVARKMLSGMKLHCEVASNGVEAVAAIRAGRQFDVVLMDMMMPVMNGVDSTREIRALGHTQLPILAMWGNSVPWIKVKCVSHMVVATIIVITACTDVCARAFVRVPTKESRECVNFSNM
ncbi:CheY-like superfamily [Dunaliella salina]|uniref:CheY-like superfamily n=1 Tax=Dunaliella salina TaxID=3046 RepID=A0ABQ7G790_DUNSA|nr:CheY-like superfamily [Dunaliella salina]|eukprot:KAF5830449.1 CheY-like superfamily [Dunaliella salina]